MFVSFFGGFSAPCGAHNKTFFYEERFIHFFECAGLLAHRSCNGCDANGTAFKFIYNGT